MQALSVVDVPVFPTLQPQYKGISSGRLDRWLTNKASTERAMQDAYNAQDAGALVEAVFNHVSRLYLGKKKSPYLDRGDKSNAPLASAVVAEVLRKIPWLPHEQPLTPYDPARAPFPWFINTLSRSRHLSMVETYWATKSGTVDKERELTDHLTDTRCVQSAISDDQAEALAQFLDTLPENQRALADECLAGQAAPETRHRFRTLLRRAAEWGAQSLPSEPIGPITVCECHRCSKRPWSSIEAVRLVQQQGTLQATLTLFKGLPKRTSRWVDWYFEPTLTGSFIDPWKSDGRRHTKPKSTDPGDLKGVPAKLYRQLEGSARQ